MRDDDCESEIRDTGRRVCVFIWVGTFSFMVIIIRLGKVYHYYIAILNNIYNEREQKNSCI